MGKIKSLLTFLREKCALRHETPKDARRTIHIQNFQQRLLSDHKDRTESGVESKLISSGFLKEA